MRGPYGDRKNGCHSPTHFFFSDLAWVHGAASADELQQRPDVAAARRSPGRRPAARVHQRLNGAGAGKLSDAIAEDFRRGAVVKIEGWQIARTQAELCALAYFATTGSL